MVWTVTSTRWGASGGAFSSLRPDPSFANQAFAHGQSATHTVIRRTINSLADGPALQVNAATDEEKAGWMQYVTLTLEFLQVHHNQEDCFVFPQARHVSNNHLLLAGEENEHTIVDDLIKWWHAVRQSVSAVWLTQVLVAETTRRFAALQKVMCATGGHLEREEQVLTADFWRTSSMTEWELRGLNDDMHRIIPQYTLIPTPQTQNIKTKTRDSDSTLKSEP